MMVFMIRVCLVYVFIILTGQYGLAQTHYAQTSQFQLSVPQFIYNEVLFEDENQLQLNLGIEDVEIRYTLDGKEPTENSALYLNKITFKESTIIKAKAFHPKFSPSETVSTHLIKLGPVYNIKNISINRKPSEKYPGLGAIGLIDRKKGTTNFRTAHWMGFAGGNLETVIEFDKVERINKVIVSVLSDSGSWIFIPETIMVYSSTDGAQYKLLDTLTISPTPEGSSNSLKFLEVGFLPTSLRFLKIKVKHFEEIPAWHPGKGTPAWLFIDEILIE